MKTVPRYFESALPICGGLVAATICLLMLTPGITVDPDGWAYWEGSVSILNGNGYRFFGGQPIVDFPPLFSLFLSLIQSVGGVSGWSLAASLVILAAATVTCFLVAYKAENIFAVGLAVWCVAGIVSLAAITGGVALIGRLAQIKAGLDEPYPEEEPPPRPADE